MAHGMIHGGGSDYNTGNRWFDKTMQVIIVFILKMTVFVIQLYSHCELKYYFFVAQIIIANDGAWGLCYEHSTSEGLTVVFLLEKIMNKIDNAGAPDESAAQQHLPPPERLEWHIVPELSQRLLLAAKSVDKRISDLDFFVYRYRGYGKTFIKSCKVSPDVYIQLALQLAYFKLVKKKESYLN